MDERAASPSHHRPADRRSASSRIWIYATVFCAAWCGAALARDTGKGRAPRLEVFPPKVRLSGPQAAQRLVVLAVTHDGRTTDRSVEARLEALRPELVKVEDGLLRPLADGTTEVVVRFDKLVVRVSVEVIGSKAPRHVSFRNEIIPILTKLGCNQGACHGSQHGKGGFKLSLLGFEPESDYTAIVKSAEQRRVTPFAPEESLILLKPTLAVAHGGGKRLESGSDSYQLLTLWLEQGAPGPRDDDPRVVDLKVYPERRLMEAGQEQRLAVIATSSDGSERDVTDSARFDTLNEGVATIRPGGLAKTVGRGEANIMVRYQGRAAMARLTVPFGREKAFRIRLEQRGRHQGGRQVARARAGSIGTVHRRRIPPPRDARCDRHHAVAGRGRRFHRRSETRTSESSWSIGFSTARNTSITGRSSGATCFASIPRSWVRRGCSRSTSGFARRSGPTSRSTGWSKSS